MQNTSALWKAMWASGNAMLESVAEIDGTVYTKMAAPVINRALMQDGLSIGNAVSATCSLKIQTDDAVIPRGAEVHIKMRLNDGQQVSEWLPAGTFFIAKRSRDKVTELLTLDCYDSMLKANAIYFSDEAYLVTANGVPIVTDTGANIVISPTWPRSMVYVAEQIANVIGVEMDARNDLRTGSDYMMEKPEPNDSVHDVLARIAAANGGNWIITPENKLRLVPVFPGLGTAVHLVVDGIVGSIATSPAETITGIRYVEDEKNYIIGTTDGGVLDAEVNAAIAEDLAAWIIGRTYQPFTFQGAIYDPAAELGDMVDRLEEIYGVMESETAHLGLAFRGDISAPESEEMSDEYPYTRYQERVFKNIKSTLATKASYEYVNQAESRANAVTAALDAALNQQGVFDRLTNNGQTQGVYLKDGKLYINGTYIDVGTINADLLRAGIISDASGKNYWVLDGSNSEFVTRKGIIGDFTLEDGSLQYGSASGGTAAYIGKDGVYYSQSYNGGTIQLKVELFPQGIRYYWNNEVKTLLYTYQSGLCLLCYDENGAGTVPWQVFNGNGVQLFEVNYRLRCDNTLGVSGNAVFDSNLTVLGTKSRVVATDQYSDRLLYCYETPSPMFGDVGEGVIGEDGRCYVWLDPVFAQTITATQYQVFLQKYGAGDCHVAERRGSCFIVEGTPGLAFGWELKAKQRDFDQKRLERNDEPFTVPAQTYGEDAARHIDELKKERIPA